MIDSQPESPPLAMETDQPHDPLAEVTTHEPGATGGHIACAAMADQPSTSSGITHGSHTYPRQDFSAAKTGW